MVAGGRGWRAGQIWVERIAMISAWSFDSERPAEAQGLEGYGKIGVGRLAKAEGLGRGVETRDRGENCSPE